MLGGRRDVGYGPSPYFLHIFAMSLKLLFKKNDKGKIFKNTGCTVTFAFQISSK